jgi:hypothetical protein
MNVRTRARERERERHLQKIFREFTIRDKKVVSNVVKTTHHARARINIQTHTRTHTHTHTERENLIKGTAL